MDWEDPALQNAFDAAIDARIAEFFSTRDPRWATVVSIDEASSTCVVDLGYDGEKTVSMGVIRPYAVGDVVRIEGTTKDRYVVDVKFSGIFPPGLILPDTCATPFAGTVKGYGQEVSRTGECRRIFARAEADGLIGGDLYGDGDGSTTFTLPDLRGRFIAFLDNMGGSDAGVLSVANTLGLTGGAETVLITQDNLPDGASITVTDPGHTHSIGSGTNVSTTGGDRQEPGSSGTATSGSSTTGISATLDGNDEPLTILPPFILLNGVITL